MCRYADFPKSFSSFSNIVFWNISRSIKTAAGYSHTTRRLSCKPASIFVWSLKRIFVTTAPSISLWIQRIVFSEVKLRNIREYLNLSFENVAIASAIEQQSSEKQIYHPARGILGIIRTLFMKNHCFQVRKIQLSMC